MVDVLNKGTREQGNYVRNAVPCALRNPPFHKGTNKGTKVRNAVPCAIRNPPFNGGGMTFIDSYWPIASKIFVSPVQTALERRDLWSPLVLCPIYLPIERRYPHIIPSISSLP